MNQVDNQKAIAKLRMEYSDLMQEYSECLKKDDVLEIKKGFLNE
jgi:hypothetical protein